jgi:subtilisin family serine protease
MSLKHSVPSVLRTRRTPLAAAFALTLLTGITVSTVGATSPTAVASQSMSSAGGVLEPDPTGTALYTIVLKEEPVATYSGSLPWLPTPARLTVPGKRSKLDLKAPSTLAYTEHLVNRQNAFLADVNSALRRPLEVTARMQHALNAVIVRLSSAEADLISKRPDVLVVERETELELHTDAGPSFIGAPAIWNGNTTSGLATSGEGIVVGIIDTGINWASPAFAAISPSDNYAHVNPRGAGNYLGACVAPGPDVGRCNDKLIGIYNFVNTSNSGTDANGHGSHTASTTAGNRWTASFANGTFAISGVAPRANIVSYLACTSGCPTTATSQSVNQAVQDGVDVINFSISGGTSPWTDTTSIAFRNANAAGIFVAASAGNTNATFPDPQGQVNHLEPWVHTVAASTQDRMIGMRGDLAGVTNPPANTQNIPLRPGAAPLPTANLTQVPLIKSPNFANGSTDGCSAYPAGTFTRVVADLPFSSGFEAGETSGAPVGGIAVLNLDGTNSSCGSGARRTAALAAGAVGVIFVDVDFLNLGASGTSWSMRRSDWNNLEAGSNPATAAISINVASQSFPSVGDRVANFSFRGPRLVGGQGMVKPDITGPGVDILAAGAAGVVGNAGVYMSNGTSMSSPHNAGAAALLAALHPTWSPSQIKSALSLSSNNTGSVNQDGTPVRLWDYGSGRMNLAKAAKVGLIMDEVNSNYVAANPAAGGEISSLNLPSIGKYNVVGNAVFTRTFTRARPGSQSYSVSTSGFPAGALTVSPTSFTIPEGGSQTITVTVSAGLLSSAQWTLGEIALTPAPMSDEPLLHLPVAMFPAGPAIAVSPSSISASSNSSVSSDLTISNTANPTLNWQAQTTGNATVIPFNTSSTSNGQLAGSYVSPTRGFHWSQNFDVSMPLRVTTLRANGFTLPSSTPLSTANTTSITFSVYADNAGEPAGAPGFGAAPLWTFTGAISAANGITTTGGAVSLNLNAANVVGTPLNLPVGRYWMTVTPTTTSSAAQTAANPLWAWFVSGDTQIGNVPRLYAPHIDAAALQPPTSGLNMLSGYVDGEVNCTLPAWVSLPTSSGALGFAGSQTIPVIFNAAGLAEGTYTGNLCISSNATNAAVVPVPLSFTVLPGSANPPTLSMAHAPGSVAAGASSKLTITLNNNETSTANLIAPLVNNLPAGVRVAATPNASTTCSGGTLTATANATSLTLSTGAQIPASGSCTAEVDVRAVSTGSYLNTLAAGALQTNHGSNAAPASSTLEVTAGAFPAPYCARSFGTTEPITLVQFAGINNPSTNALGPPSLQDFLSVSGTVRPGSTYLLTVKGNSDGNYLNVYRAYIDWNQDGVFEESAAERYELGSITNSTGLDTLSTSGYIAVPSNVTAGSTRMRVVKNYNSAGAACGTPSGTFGQAEDYRIVIDPAAATPPVLPTLSKSTSPAVQTVDQPSVLTVNISLVNATGGTGATTTADLVDTLPAGVVVAPVPNASTTCGGGTVTAVAGGNTVTLVSGASIPESGCSFRADIVASAPGMFTNTLPVGALQTTAGNSAVAATARYRTIAANQPNYSVGFEAPFTAGGINGQQGWVTGGTAAQSTVSTAQPFAGTQHLRITSNTSTTGPSAISPTQVVGTSAFSVLSAKVRITRTTDGSTYEINPQDPVNGTVSTLLRFDRGVARAIQIADFSTGLYVNTGAVWPLDTYFDLLMKFNRSTGALQVCIDGVSIYNGTTAVASPYIGNVVARQISQTGSTAGNFLNVDDLVINNTDSVPACSVPPEAPRTTRALENAEKVSRAAISADPQ